MSYPINGAIFNKQQLAIVTDDRMILTQDSTGKYIWQPLTDSVPNDYIALIVYVDTVETYSQPVNFQLTNSFTGKWVVFNTNGNVSDTNEKPSPLKAKQALYQPWYKPFAFFPGASYSLEVDQISLSQRYYFIPMLWYKSGYCGLPSSSTSAINLHYQWSISDNGLDNYGWTSQSDCRNGIVYKICSIGNMCQTTCKGPCPTSKNECEWLNNQFVCQRSLFSISFWQSNIFMWILLAIVLFLVVTIIITIFWSRGQNGRIQSSQNKDG